MGELPGGHGLLRASHPILSRPILSLPVCCCAWLSPESGCCALLRGVFHLSQVLSPCLGGMQDVLLLKVRVQLAVVRHRRLFLPLDVREEISFSAFWTFKASAKPSRTFYSSGLVFFLLLFFLFFLLCLEEGRNSLVQSRGK